MIPTHNRRQLLGPGDLQPSRDDLKVVGVFNPGVVDVGDETVVLARISETACEPRTDAAASPRWREDGSGMVVDWLSFDDWFYQDACSLEDNSTGFVRLTFASHLRVFRFPKSLQRPVDGAPLSTAWLPAGDMEIYGIEDPRITPLDGGYYLSYVVVSPAAACTALARTADFHEFERLGVAFPPENKDVLVFPEKIGGRYVALHRPNPRYRFKAPEMWIGYSPDLVHWGDHHPLIWPDGCDLGTWCGGKVGGGCMPVRTNEGWLAIYHGNAKPPDGAKGETGMYVAAALLLDLDDPTRVIGYSREPLFTPQAEFETTGFLGNVLFPTGLLDRGSRWAIVYGAADENVGVLEVEKDDLLTAITAITPI